MSDQEGNGAQPEDSGDSPIPSWIRNHSTPYKDPICLSGSSDEGEELLSQPALKTLGAGMDAGGLQPQPSDLPSSLPSTQLEASQKPAGATGDGEDGGDNDKAKASGSGLPLPEEIQKATGINRSEVAIMLPEKLNRNKVIVELEPAEHGATDLSGDSGAVGRLIVSGKAGAEEIRLDLKGIVYKASIHPLAGTMFVLNIGQTDAKVEALCTDYVRLKEESNFYASEAVMEGNMAEDLSDDEPAAAPAGDKAAGQPTEKAIKKKASGSVDAFKALLKGKGGVQKKSAAAISSKPVGAGKSKGAAAKKPAAGKSKGPGAKKKPTGKKAGGFKGAGKK